MTIETGGDHGQNSCNAIGSFLSGGNDLSARLFNQSDDAQKVKTPILTFLGTEDRIPVSGVEAMHAVFDSTGVENAYQIYDGAQHAFFNDTRQSYDEEAATDAWTQTLAWFGKHLKG